MKLNIFLFLCVFLLIVACTRIDKNIETQQSPNIDTHEEAAKNSAEVVGGLSNITNDLNDIEDIVS